MSQSDHKLVEYIDRSFGLRLTTPPCSHSPTTEQIWVRTSSDMHGPTTWNDPPPPMRVGPRDLNYLQENTTLMETIQEHSFHVKYYSNDLFQTAQLQTYYFTHSFNWLLYASVKSEGHLKGSNADRFLKRFGCLFKWLFYTQLNS